MDFQSSIKGFSREKYEEHKNQLFCMDGINICGIYTHSYECYQDDDTKTRSVLEEYAAVFSELPPQTREKLTLSLLTSVSFFKYPEYSFDMVRLGAALYGLPLGSGKTVPRLEPIMSVRSTVINIMQVTQTSNFDYTGKLPDNVRTIAHISIGCWDIPNIFRGSECCTVIRDHLCRIVGEPCMDTCCVDITGLDDIRLNDEVLFLGDRQGVRFNDLAKRCGYNIYDCQMLFAGMSRLVKEYI